MENIDSGQVSGEHGSREWGVLHPLKNDKISMFGTPQKPRMRQSLIDLMRMEPRRREA